MSQPGPIILGADHAGFQLKEAVKRVLHERGYSTDDVGTDSENSVDYPLVAQSVATRVIADQTRGILVCGSGNGMAIAANKVPGTRAVNARDAEEARLSREHNDSNVLALAGRRLSAPHALLIVDAFLRTPFEGGRHQRRVDQLEYRPSLRK